MTSKPSKKTLALLEFYPDFCDWIVANMTPSQFMAVKEAPLGTVWFGEGHPLNSEELGVQLWRSYKDAVIFELECHWGEDTDFAQPPKGCVRLAYFHHSVCDAIKLFAWSDPAILEKIVERQRSEIETALRPAKHSNVRPGSSGRL